MFEKLDTVVILEKELTGKDIFIRKGLYSGLFCTKDRWNLSDMTIFFVIVLGLQQNCS